MKLYFRTLGDGTPPCALSNFLLLRGPSVLEGVSGVGLQGNPKPSTVDLSPGP